MVTSATARVPGLQTPGTCERGYRDAGAPATSPVDERGAAFALLRQIAHGSPCIEILGPSVRGERDS